MSYEDAVSEHYSHGDLLGAIQAGISQLGKTTDNVTVADLGAVDEFHIGGRIATDHLLSQLYFSEQDHILDVGCGLGGTSRFTAAKFNNRVTGIDLTQEYIDTGKVLCTWCGMEGRVVLLQGSALSMPFDDETFDGGVMLHVGMNIEDKAGLFAEIHRVLRPGASLGVYDIMRINEGDLAYPVPWATDAGTSKLATLEEYENALGGAGFSVSTECRRGDFALAFFKEMRAKMEANGGPPPLGLHTLMGKMTPVKLKKMIDNIAAGYVAPVEVIAQKAA